MYTMYISHLLLKFRLVSRAESSRNDPAFYQRRERAGLVKRGPVFHRSCENRSIHVLETK